MSFNSRFFPGASVSRYLSPVGRAWAGVVVQTGYPLTDADYQLTQDLAAYALARQAAPSGWLGAAGVQDFTAIAPGTATNVVALRALDAVVAGLPVRVEYAGTMTAGANVIALDDPPELGGTAPDVKRTDFVFLEVWLALVSPSLYASGSVYVDASLPAPGDTVTIDGIVLTAVSAAPGVDEFLIGADEAATAGNIASAINDPLNSFVGTVTATADGVDTVEVRAASLGTAGNAITLAVTGSGMTVSGATLSGGVDGNNRPSASTIWRNGGVQSPSGVNLADDLLDPDLGSETTQRVQVQWRIRVTGQAEAVNFKTEPFGFENTSILAQGSTSSPVAGYTFLPADGSSVSGSSSAANYGTVDGGLWVAGDGTEGSATDLCTVDGFVYAIPLAQVFRRNDAYLSGTGVGFDPLSNTNGALPYGHTLFANPAVGSIPANVSDRPDGYFCDVIAVPDDILDLRRTLLGQTFSPGSELTRQVSLLLDGQNRTWGVDGADRTTLGGGSGDVSTRHLVCDQFGRATAKGGVVPSAGDTTRGPTVRNFDHFARRFGAQPVTERVVLAVLPTWTAAASGSDPTGHPGIYVLQSVGGRSGWSGSDQVVIDLDALNASSLGSFDPATDSFAGASVLTMAPPGTTITDILSIYHDDGHYVTPVDQTVLLSLIEGLGTSTVVLTLDSNSRTVNGGDPGNADHPMVGGGSDNGSTRRIFVELEVAYPAGYGTNFTPDTTEPLAPNSGVYAVGPVLENDTTQRPLDFVTLTPPVLTEGKRTVKLEYVADDGAGSAISDEFVSWSAAELVLLRRPFGSGLYPVTVEDAVDGLARTVLVSDTEYGSSSRLVVLDPAGANGLLSGAQTLVNVTYYAQDAIPNYGADGYQVGVYYRTVAPATVGVQSGAMAVVPDPVTFEVLATADVSWSLVAGAGSNDASFPFAAPGDFVPSTASGEWFFQGVGHVSVADFGGDVGMVRLHNFVAAVPSPDLTLSGKGKDSEFRATYDLAETAAGYRPSTAAQPLSGAARHRTVTAALVRASADTTLYRAGELLVLVFTETYDVSDQNAIIIPATPADTLVSVYRTVNLLISK